ncbi:pseudouridine synthase [Phlebopus sp. FC_14]|nr:pseudouridine synthase [Phlebopus sp. FC_14]
MAPNYAAWSKEDLIARLTDLELRIKSDKTLVSPPRRGRPFHFHKHPVRKIAVKFCYSGWEYNGLAHQAIPTPLPTVEDVLFQAFAKSRLVDPDAGFEGCGWEKCGRTDVGVSAAGQVVSLWVRSALPGDSTEPLNTSRSEAAHEDLSSQEAQSTLDATPETNEDSDSDSAFPGLIDEPPSNSSMSPAREQQELHYALALNKALPPTIRVLAWSPVSPDFSARHNCLHRHYKYFFTSRGLDVALMQQAASYLVGLHDFRNLSKLDPSKQLKAFHRRILRAEISPAAGQGNGQLYVFDLVGSAFLYHQVRHIMAVLLLVGAGLEPPSIIPTLMNVDGTETSASGSPLLETVDRKPVYEMADGLPLMLWDCAFADSDVQWQTDDGFANTGLPSDLVHKLDSVYQRSLIQTTIEAHFLVAADQYRPRTGDTTPAARVPLSDTPLPGVPLGGGSYRRAAKYVPLLSRQRLDHVEVANERWRNGKGSRRGERPDKHPREDDDE